MAHNVSPLRTTCTFAGAALAVSVEATRASGAAARPSTVVMSPIRAERRKVVLGDTLWAISQRYGVTLTALLRANRLSDKATIVPGQKLAIPAAINTSSSPITKPVQRPVLGRSFPAELRNDASLSLIPLFVSAARESGVATDLLMGLAFTESSWRPWVRSRDGAIGLGQLLPATVEWVGPNLLGARLDASRSGDNLRMAAAYVRWLQKRFNGDNSRALAAYFEGAGYVEKNGPSRAGRNYAASVLRNRAMFVTAAA
jgi:N-acetylmuramoyl-L-alanine amidase